MIHFNVRARHWRYVVVLDSEIGDLLAHFGSAWGMFAFALIYALMVGLMWFLAKVDPLLTAEGMALVFTMSAVIILPIALIGAVANLRSARHIRARIRKETQERVA